MEVLWWFGWISVVFLIILLGWMLLMISFCLFGL